MKGVTVDSIKDAADHPASTGWRSVSTSSRVALALLLLARRQPLRAKSAGACHSACRASPSKTRGRSSCISRPPASRCKLRAAEAPPRDPPEGRGVRADVPGDRRGRDRRHAERRRDLPQRLLLLHAQRLRSRAVSARRLAREDLPVSRGRAHLLLDPRVDERDHLRGAVDLARDRRPARRVHDSRTCHPGSTACAPGIAACRLPHSSSKSRAARSRRICWSRPAPAPSRACRSARA